MPTFNTPRTIDEASRLLSAAPQGFALAGGTDLLVQMRSGARSPAAIIDLKRIPGMQSLVFDAQGARIGAAMAAHAIGSEPRLRQQWPGLVEAVCLIGSKQVQGRASIGGNLCNASPAADSVPALVANSAVIVIVGPQGERRVAAEDFCLAPGRNVLAPGEFVQAIELPQPAARTADAYLRFIPRSEMDIAVVGAAASLTLDEEGVCRAARIALGAVAPTVLLVPEAAAALIGSVPDEQRIAVCIDAVRAAARPISDRRGSAEFRRHVVGVLAGRAVRNALQRIHATA